MLYAQPTCVVLFDEIDHFLLDRDSAYYSDQDTAFQFMTPGMLTKLNDLRRSERCVFVVATNYEDRIDPAIKRTGRIDVKYLVLPPDGMQRREILTKLVAKNADDPLPFLEELWSGSSSIVKNSLFLGYSDLKAASLTLARNPDWTPQVFADYLKDRARTTSIEMYAPRFERDGSKSDRPQQAMDLSKTPIAEFLGLCAMLEEVPGRPTESEIAVIGKVARLLGASGPITEQRLFKLCEVRGDALPYIKTLLTEARSEG